MASQKKQFKFPVVGLTGGMGSGKSTVLSMFKNKGAVVFDADEIVHDILRDDQQVLRVIRKKFGEQVFDRGGNLNRRALGEIIFSSPSKKVFLEKLIHPLVRKKMSMAWKENKKCVVICDIPLLYETSQMHKFDVVVVVYASKKVRQARLQKKGFLPHEIKKRFAAQMSLEKKARKSDVVINNNGTKKQTQDQINRLWPYLIQH